MGSATFEKSLDFIAEAVAVIPGQRDISKGLCCLPYVTDNNISVPYNHT